MPHVSKNKLDNELYQESFIQLTDLLVGLNKSEARKILVSLLTPTEQIMLTKRCAAVLMMSKGYSDYKIWNTLNLSPSTVARINYMVEAGKYKDLVQVLAPKRKSARDKEKFIKKFNKIMRLGMPAMTGTERSEDLRL